MADSWGALEDEVGRITLFDLTERRQCSMRATLVFVGMGLAINAMAALIATNDSWDVSQGVTVTAASPLEFNSDRRDAFGVSTPMSRQETPSSPTSSLLVTSIGLSGKRQM